MSDVFCNYSVIITWRTFGGIIMKVIITDVEIVIENNYGDEDVMRDNVQWKKLYSISFWAC